MTLSGLHAWVTSAVDKNDVDKALLLAGSLRRVHTCKKLVVLMGASIPRQLSERLHKVFDLVVPIKCGAPDGWWKPEDCAKVDAFSLQLFSKCVYLCPNSVVLTNCDDIFEKYGEFAVCASEKECVDSSIFLFTPSPDLANSLWKLSHNSSTNPVALSTGLKKSSGNFAECFNLWIRNNIPNWERLDRRYNVRLSLTSGSQESLSSHLSIVRFDEMHPLDLVMDEGQGLAKLQDLGAIEKFVVKLCATIYSEDVALELIGKGFPQGQDVFKTEPIAIVGMSFRLPGANTTDEFWDLLISGKEAIQRLPKSRWTRKDTHYPCENRNVEAGFLSFPIGDFDSKFFGISGNDVEWMDPQQRLLHEVAWEALEDAMVDPHSLQGTQTGVFVGAWLQDYKDMLAGTTDIDFLRTYLGNSLTAGAARLSHFMGTTGPSIGVESGCSSAMVAVDMACKSLRNRESSLALAGGVNLFLNPFDYNSCSMIFAPDGRCKTFDEGANGFGRAEGCAVLVMKRLSDAVRNGDNIWGLVRGSAVTQEGVSKSLGTPTVHCESLAMELALRDGGVDPLDVSYVEAHGTGTFVGDPIEVAAIHKAYSKGRSVPLVIGSVKTNVGHTESVAGITGMIKVLLSMKHGLIPPHLNFKTLNPAINLDAIPAVIPLEALPWPVLNSKPRMAGVSSFGMGGSDSHVIIQERPVISVPQIHEDDIRPLHIMKISAKSPESLEQLLTIYENMLDSEPAREESFADLAFSANIGRATFNHRAVLIANDFKDAAATLQNKSYKIAEVSPGSSKLCFLFTGQGSQYPQMGAVLYKTSPIFRDVFNKCDRILSRRYGINLQQVMWGEASNAEELSRSLYSQTSIFCIEYSLLKLWESWGVKPDYVMGHSLGEFCAAVAAGILDFEDALMLVAERSRLIDNLPRGKMLVIKADKKEVDKNIANFKKINPNFWVDYAAFNSPDQTVVAGDSNMIEQFAKYCCENKLKTIQLAASHAFHSRHMEPILNGYRKIAVTVRPFGGVIDPPIYISGVEGGIIDLDSINPGYWVRHTREPVNFMDAFKAAQLEGCSLFIEVGPHPVLSALTMTNMEGQSIACFPSIRRKEGEWVTMLDSLAKLYLSDWKGEVDWKGFDRYYRRSRVSLPFYPFNRKPVLKDFECILPTLHPLLGKPTPTACDSAIFEAKITLKNTPFIQDHVVGNTVLFPGAAFLEMCLSGGHAGVQGGSLSGEFIPPQRPVVLKSLKILSPLAFPQSMGCVRRLQTITKMNLDGQNELGYSVGVHRHVATGTSGGVGEWFTHATANYFPVAGPLDQDTILEDKIDIAAIQSSWPKIDNTWFYGKLPAVGLRFGPKFKSTGEFCWRKGSETFFKVNVPGDNHAGYLIHPIVADAMIQATMRSTINDDETIRLRIPVHVGEFRWLQTSSSTSRYIYCKTNEESKISCILLDGEGSHLAYMTGVDFIETTAKLMEGMIQQQESAMPGLWREVWKSSPGPLQSSLDFTEITEAPMEFTEGNKRAIHDINNMGEYETSFHQDIAHARNGIHSGGLDQSSACNERALEEIHWFLPALIGGNRDAHD